MAPMPKPRFGHSCGLVQNPANGPEVIVAGDNNLNSVDIYEINADSWRAGNSTILNKQTF